MQIFKILTLTLILVLFLYKNINPTVYTDSKDYIHNNIQFTEVSSKYNINYVHKSYYPKTKNKSEYNINNLYSGVPTSVAVSDINKDGFQDILIANPDPSKGIFIYLNNGKNFFKKKTIALSSYNKDFITSIATFDLNNDGIEEIILGRYGCHTILTRHIQGDYNYTELTMKYCSNSWNINITDLNNDNLPDIAFANYYPNIDVNTTWPTWRINLARGDDINGGRNSIAYNLGDFEFKVIDKYFPYYAHTAAIGFGYFNSDNKLDLFWGNDVSYDRMYFQTEKGFKHVTEKSIPKKWHGFSGMNSEIIDHDNDGDLDLYVSNIYRPPFANAFNLLWINDGNGIFKNVSHKLNIHKCGWSWSAKYADFDNDGIDEIMVTNGQFQGKEVTEKKQSINEWFLKNRKNSTTSILRDLFKSEKRNTERLNYSGQERSCLFKKSGESYIDIAKRSGLEKKVNTRAMATIDIDNDGKIDVIKVNYNDKLLLYKNNTKSQNRWIGFNLLDKNNNCAVSSKASLHFKNDSTVRTKIVFPLNGFNAQSDCRLHFGLQTKTPSELRVHYKNQKYHIKRFHLNKYNEVKLE